MTRKLPDWSTLQAAISGHVILPGSPTHESERGRDRGRPGALSPPDVRLATPSPPVRRRSRAAPERRPARGQARLLHLREVPLGPLANGLEQRLQGYPQRGQRVLDLGRDHGVYLPRYEAVVLEVPEGLDEHLLGDSL